MSVNTAIAVLLEAAKSNEEDHYWLIEQCKAIIHSCSKTIEKDERD